MKTKAVLLLLVILTVSATATQPTEDRGAMGLAQALNRLDVVASVLHTGAHPDDENSALLSWLSRGQGARTAYLSITRGDGGQNLLGTELFENLGVIRTEELLAARRLDGAQQFFTPNYDFGFSKTAEEGMEKWGHDKVLGDFVRVIRQFRPEIIISRFTGTPADGHGHHQIAGIITQEAFKAAADPKLYPEYGKPWQAKKLYLNGGGRGGQGQGQGQGQAQGRGQAQGQAPAQGQGRGQAPNPAQGQAQGQALAPAQPPGITINVGEFDLALGQSYSEIAAEGRSLHRSQSQGAAQNKGPSNTSIQLVQKSVDVADTAGLFDGVIYKIKDLSQLDASITSDVTDLQTRISAIRQKVNLLRPAEIVPDLTASLQLLQRIRSKTTNEQVQFLLKQKEADFQEATRLAAGLVLDVIAADDTVIPGQTFNLTVSVINGGPLNLTVPKISTDLPPGWTATLQRTTGSIQPGQKLDQVFSVTVPANAEFTQPYWLKQPRQGDRFVWPEGSPANMPFDPPLLQTHADIEVNGATISPEQPAQFRRTDGMLGEQRSLLKVVPALSVRVSPDIAVIPLAGNHKKEFDVTIENQNTAAAETEVRLVLPAGWSVEPATRTLKFTRQGELATAQFMVTTSSTAGKFKVQAIAKSGNQEFKTGYTPIAYPHIETRYVYSPAESTAEIFDVQSLVTSVGYVEGAGDKIPEALQQLGVKVTKLSSDDLATGDLSRFPTIVLGVRAYGVREDLVTYNKRILDYVSNGGTLIVQYNRAGETQRNQFGPYPFTINDNGRVTREEAPVKILNPALQLFNVPNRISSGDFDGWVQERGNYFLSTWDPRYTPILESADPNEQPQQGGMVMAKVGKGTYIYTGYGFFRQLPDGVPGAYRLFANLISIEN
jgi:LmbE family N-acetylglucosaminyl deacetylase